MEPRKQDQRLIPKTYYYIDYKEFVDVVKWKMYKMQTNVRDKLRTDSENKGYVCQNCEKQFSPLDVLSLVDMTDNLFHCDVCDHILEENDNADNVKGSQQNLTRLREQSQPIITLLKQTDSLQIPTSYIYKHAPGSRSNGANHGKLDKIQRLEV
jgi:transcription initiation factor TFIIE subunit alpha